MATTTRDVAYTFFSSVELPAPAGFHNGGSSCWCNSILQSLITTPAIRLLRAAPPELRTNPVVAALIAAHDKSSVLGPLTPAGAGALTAGIDFLEALRRAPSTAGSRRFTGYQQECADEALAMIFSAISYGPLEDLFTSVYECSITCPACAHIDRSRVQAVQIELFAPGKLATREDFQKYILEHMSPVDLYKCPSCGITSANLPRRESLRVLREIVVIVMNKYGAAALDARRPIDPASIVSWFPTSLQFASTRGTVLHYDLVAQVEHVGSVSSGHYWAIALRRPGAPYQLNDSSVSAGTLGPTPNTYMAFFCLSRELPRT